MSNFISQLVNNGQWTFSGQMSPVEQFIAQNDKAIALVFRQLSLHATVTDNDALESLWDLACEIHCAYLDLHDDIRDFIGASENGWNHYLQIMFDEWCNWDCGTSGADLVKWLVREVLAKDAEQEGADEYEPRTAYRCHAFIESADGGSDGFYDLIGLYKHPQEIIDLIAKIDFQNSSFESHLYPDDCAHKLTISIERETVNPNTDEWDELFN